MADPLVIVRREDALGRPTRTVTYGPGDPKPDWVTEALPDRETQVIDEREEVKHLGGGWYQLPGGEKVRGKEAVRDAGYDVGESDG